MVECELGVLSKDIYLAVTVSLDAECIRVLKKRPWARLAVGESAIKCPSPLNVLKDAYDHSSY
jgi:hypothetical protein